VNPITARPLTLELYGAPGALEEVALEARGSIAHPWKPHKFGATAETPKGFVRVRGASWDLACELCARLSTVHDVRLAFPPITVSGWDDLPRAVSTLPWDALFDTDEPLEIRTEAFPGALAHAGRLRQTIEDVFDAHGFRAPNPDEPFTRLEFTAAQTHLRVRVSLGGDALHKRGWRAGTGTLATLREDLAAAALRRLAAFEPRALRADHIAVPFAGSGTLGVEAWHALGGLPPAIWGAERTWQRLAQPSPSSRTWWQNRIRRAAREARLPRVTFIERDAEQFAELEGNVRRVRTVLGGQGVSVPSIETWLEDAFETSGFVKHGEVTLLPLHPPYGLRLARASDIGALYARLGRAVQNWGLEATRSDGALVGFCLCPSEEVWRAFLAGLEGVRVQTSHVSQGGLDVRLVAFATPG
jgi:23S rRNA G2445 N2-methylase RlmL